MEWSDLYPVWSWVYTNIAENSNIPAKRNVLFQGFLLTFSSDVAGHIRLEDKSFQM